MKHRLAKLLLALSLVLNPVAVFAQGYDQVGVEMSQESEAANCHPSTNLEEMTELAALDSNNDCEMPCCAEMNCVMQGDCVLSCTSVILLNKQLSVSGTTAHQTWTNSNELVPVLELPPDSPPPIHG